MLKKCGAGGRTKRKKRAALLAEVFTPKKPQDASSEGYSSSKTAMRRNETPIALYRGFVSQDQHFWASIFSHIKSTDTGFADGLRYRRHTNGNLATVHFALDRNWSRNLLEQLTDGKSNLERLRDAAKSIVDGREFLWQANKSVPDNFFRDAVNDFRTIPYEFDTVHDMVFLSALNPSPAHARFLQSRGLTSEEIDRQGYCGVAYQAVMRTSLRDATDSTPKNIIVPDERLALYLGDMLPGAIIKKMDTGIADETNKGGRPRVYQNNAEKMRRRRTNEAEKTGSPAS